MATKKSNKNNGNSVSLALINTANLAQKKQSRGLPFNAGYDERRHLLTGRPLGVKNKSSTQLFQRLADEMNEPVPADILEGLGISIEDGTTFTWMDLTIYTWRIQAALGDANAREALLNRTVGKVPDKVELTPKHEIDYSVYTPEELDTLITLLDKQNNAK